MDKFIASAAVILGFCLNANAATPSCYNMSGVSAQVPYLLTLQKVQPFQMNLLTEDLTAEGLLSVSSSLPLSSDIYVWSLSVDSQQVASVPEQNFDRAVDEAVAQKIKEVAKKYKFKKKNISLDCNRDDVHVLPRAGGSTLN
jgi:hypothetical protein